MCESLWMFERTYMCDIERAEVSIWQYDSYPYIVWMNPIPISHVLPLHILGVFEISTGAAFSF